MPEQLRKVTKEEAQAIAANAVKKFGTQGWFRDVAIYNAHPTDGHPTIEFKVNNIPVLIQKEIMAFAEENNMRHRFVVVDFNGKPVE